MARCGLGHALDAALSFYSTGDLSGVRVYPIVPYGSRTLGIITHSIQSVSPAVREMIHCLEVTAHSWPDSAALMQMQKG